jgi:subtilisin-like proprotein convertase family protein
MFMLMKTVRPKLLMVAALLLSVTLIGLAATGSRAVASSGGEGPAGSGREVAFLTGPNEGEPLEIALRYLNQHLGELGLTRQDVADLAVSSQYRSEHNGTTHIYLQQRYLGIAVFNALMNINIDRDGRVINLGNRFLPRLSETITGREARLSAEDAVRAAAAGQGLVLSAPLIQEKAAEGSDQRVRFSDGGISLEPIPAWLVYQPLADGTVRLAWAVEIYTLDAHNWWNLRLDAASGRLLDQFDYVIHDTFDAPDGGAAAQFTLALGRASQSPLAPNDYLVYAMPAESPNHVSPVPPADGRVAVNAPWSTASPYGWHDTNGSPGAESQYSVGNNVDAYEDSNNSNSPTGGNAARAYGGPDLDFSHPIDLTQEPSTYRPAAITNLFYWNNIIHDVFHAYGFNEAAGNFQENNYGNGGLGSDSVNAEAQDGGGTNNANFATPTDGGNPRMQMYLWNLTTPQRDGDLDNGIIIHEYGHGISIRLTGGPQTSSCLGNQEQGGEGWSDWFGLMLTMETGDQGTDRRGIGTYALGQPTTGTGIRTHPYSTDMTIDPRTYDTIKTAAVPHGVGSVWAAMLWEVTWALTNQYGFDTNFYTGSGGNNMALQLVVDGLKLQPCSPGFVDARNAILLADQNNYGGANQCLLWTAFAKRGLGYSASQGSSNNRGDGTQAFDLPVECQGPPPTNTPGPSPTPTNTPLPTTCTTYTSTNVPISLPNGTSSISSVLNISGSGPIVDANVSVDMAHVWVGDLAFDLQHQDTGTTVRIIDRPGVPASTYGCSGDNILATLDDEAAQPVEDQCAGSVPTINGTFSPNQPLSAFDGQSGNGTWVLTVTDFYTSADAGTLNGWSVEICVADGGDPTATPVPPTATNTPQPTATNTPQPTATNTPLPTATNTPLPTATPGSGTVIYVSSSTNGTAGGVSFADEDILAYDTATGTWSMYFDGSDVGITGDVNAFHILPDGSILMSLDASSTTVSGVGSVQDRDIIRFVPTSLGPNTAGTFELYFDGSDVGFGSSSEDIDALYVLANGDLLISTIGSFSVTGASGNDEDLVRFTPTSLGSNTSGTWSFYFDGSDVGLNNSASEDVVGISVDESTGRIYLTTLGSFSVSGVSGDGADIFSCLPGSLGSTTSCTFSMFWDGSLNGFAGEVLDAFEIVFP